MIGESFGFCVYFKYPNFNRKRKRDITEKYVP
jgi:hypothetical protein